MDGRTMNGWMNIWTSGWFDAWMNGWSDERTDGWTMNGRTDGCIEDDEWMDGQSGWFDR